MIQFEWDEAKARTNRIKHGITFEEAILVFDDPYVLSEQDRVVDGENRWQSVGLVHGALLLLVAHTSDEAVDEESEIVRIVSARKASRKERIRYGENRAKNPG
jgi:uncharacterized DUF497 family protein